MTGWRPKSVLLDLGWSRWDKRYSKFTAFIYSSTQGVHIASSQLYSTHQYQTWTRLTLAHLTLALQQVQLQPNCALHCDLGWFPLFSHQGWISSLSDDFSLIYSLMISLCMLTEGFSCKIHPTQLSYWHHLEQLVCAYDIPSNCTHSQNQYHWPNNVHQELVTSGHTMGV